MSTDDEGARVSLTRLATRVPATAAWVVSHPFESTSRAVGFAKGVVVGGIGLVKVARQAATDAPAAEDGVPAPRTTPESASETVTPSAPPPPDPFQDREPPIPVVEEALAAEQEEPPPLGGPATEPHAVTREEAHGEAPFVREEREELEEETAEALGLDEDQPV